MTSSTRQLLDVLKGLPTLVTSAEREENDLSALREELVQKDKMYREKCTQFETFKGSHRDCQSRQDGDRALIDKLQKEKASLEKALREKEKELEENRQRLSKIMGMKIMDNNPEIADLSDPNRPTKLGERYGELYDNEWTDAYETLSKRYDEKQVVKKLYDIFQFVFQYCYKFSRKQEEDLKEAMLVPQSKMEEVLPDFVLKQFKDNRKLGSNEFLKSHFEDFKSEYRKCHLYESSIDTFVKECFEISWLMNIQDPPIEIDTKTNRHDTFDSNAYKAYTASGPTVDYVVWPTARLHRGGPILFKGVAQCIPRPASSTGSSRRRNNNDSKSPTRPSTAMSNTRTSAAQKNESVKKQTTLKPNITSQSSSTTETITHSASMSTDSKTGIDDKYTSKKPSGTMQSVTTTNQDIGDLLDSFRTTTTLFDNSPKSARNKNLSTAGIHRSQPKEAWTARSAETGKLAHVSSAQEGSGTPPTTYDQLNQTTSHTPTQWGTQTMRTGGNEQQQNFGGLYSGSHYSTRGFSQSLSASSSQMQASVNDTGNQNNAGEMYQSPASKGDSSSQVQTNQAPIQQSNSTYVKENDIKTYYNMIHLYGFQGARYYMGASRFDAVYVYLNSFDSYRQ